MCVFLKLAHALAYSAGASEDRFLATRVASFLLTYDGTLTALFLFYDGHPMSAAITAAWSLVCACMVDL